MKKYGGGGGFEDKALYFCGWKFGGREGEGGEAVCLFVVFFLLFFFSIQRAVAFCEIV